MNHLIKEEEKMGVLDNLIEKTIEPIVISLDSSDDACNFSEEDDAID